MVNCVTDRYCELCSDNYNTDYYYVYYLIASHKHHEYTLHTDRLTEGMRELEPILEKRDVILCVPLLLVYAHKKCTPVGKLLICCIHSSRQFSLCSVVIRQKEYVYPLLCLYIKFLWRKVAV